MNRKHIVALSVALLLLCSAGQAWADAYTTTATGTNWSAQTHWALVPSDGTDGDDGVPGDGDTATIGHNTTIDENTTVGTSPDDQTTNVLTIAANKTLTVGTGIVFTIKGNIGSGGVTTLNPGSSWLFDATGSATPQTGYRWNLVNWWGMVAAGESGNRCTYGAVTGSLDNSVYWGSAYFSTSASYCDFVNVGPATAFTIGIPAAGAYVDHCTFTNCRCPSIGSSGGLPVTFTNNTITSGRTTGSGVLSISVTGALTSGSRLFDSNVIHGYTTLILRNGTVSNSVFDGRVSGGTGYVGTVMEDCLIIGPNSSAAFFSPTQGYSSIINCYILANDEDGRPHGLVDASSGAENQTWDGCVFDFFGPDEDDYGDVLTHGAGNASYKVTVRNCIVTESPAGKGYGWLHSFLGGVNHYADSYHNTCAVGVGGTGIGTAHTYVGHAGMLANCKSNLFYCKAGGSGYLAERGNHASTPIQDIITPANFAYNWGWNVAGYDDNELSAPTMFSTEPANVGGGTADPGFVDSTRSFVNWGETVHETDGSVAAALAVVAADTSLIAAANTGLVAWVKAGFAPTNKQLHDAGHDNVTIGAISYAGAAETGTYLFTAPTIATGKTGRESGNFTIALDTGQYPGTIIFTPAAADVAGTFTPATLTLTNLTRSGTFTFTPTSPNVGTATITTTDDGSMTDPAGVEYEVTAAGGGGGRRIIGGGIIDWKPGQQWPLAMR